MSWSTRRVATEGAMRSRLRNLRLLTYEMVVVAFATRSAFLAAEKTIFLHARLTLEKPRARCRIVSLPLEYPSELCDTKFLTGKTFLKCDGKGGEPIMGKKFVSLSAITLFAFTLTFVGCGKKEEPAPPPPPPAPAAPAEPAPPAAAAPSEPSKDAAPMPDKPEEKKDEAKTK